MRITDTTDGQLVYLLRHGRTHLNAEGRLHVHQIVDPRLTDRDYGPQTGLTSAEVTARWGSLDAAPGVEPASGLLLRARAALEDAAERFAPGPVIVVTHDAVIRALLGWIAPGLAVTVPTASWQVLRRSGAHWSVLGADCTADLPQGTQPEPAVDR